MKTWIKDFFRRGFLAAWGGPVVWAIVYWILFCTGQVSQLHVNKVISELLTVTLLAFVAGGINAVYHVERLPLLTAILIHGGVLYLSYLVIYLFNGWLAMEGRAMLIFSTVFLLSYALIWAVIYLTTRKKTKAMNQKLAQFRKSCEET